MKVFFILIMMFLKNNFLYSKDIKCPRCGSENIVEYVYGELNDSGMKDEKDGKILSGGCVISIDSPSWHCKQCGKDFECMSDPYVEDAETMHVTVYGCYKPIVDFSITKEKGKFTLKSSVEGKPEYVKTITLNECLEILNKALEWDTLDPNKYYPKSLEYVGVNITMETKGGSKSEYSWTKKPDIKEITWMNNKLNEIYNK